MFYSFSFSVLYIELHYPSQVSQSHNNSDCLHVLINLFHILLHSDDQLKWFFSPRQIQSTNELQLK